jgi:hypothetical protein
VAIHLADSVPDRLSDLDAGARPLAAVLPPGSVQPLAAALLVAGGSVMALTANRLGVSGAILAVAAAGAAGALSLGAVRWTVALAAMLMTGLWLWSG